MPTTVLDDPLRLACVFSDGSRAAFDLTGSPNPWLVRPPQPIWALIWPPGWWS